MRVLVACEFSGIVREAFNARAQCYATSCDLLPPEDGRVDCHIQGDVLDVLRDDWDMMIAHPPCDHLAVSGARWFPEKRADGRQQAAIEFFMALVNAPIPHIAIENPIGIMSRLYRKPDQIIQPWQFGHPESKSTCLWLKGLPKIAHKDVLPLPASGRWTNQTPSGQNKLGPSPTRAADRARTYTGIATAMAEQWSR